MIPDDSGSSGKMAVKTKIVVTVARAVLYLQVRHSKGSRSFKVNKLRIVCWTSSATGGLLR